MQTTEYIWFDGKMVPSDQARVHVLTHALHYGSAIFEGIRAYACADGSSAVFRLEDHCKRLLNSAKILRMEVPYNAEQLAKACVETLQANKLKEGYIRPLSFVGYGEMGVYPGNNPVQTIVAAWPWGAYLGPEALEKGIRIKTSSFARSHVNTSMSKAKASGNYINSILAKVEAKEDGYDEAIMLDTNGFVRRYDPVIDELLEVTDLVMLDLKQMNDEIHQNLVGVSNHRTLEFAKYLANKNVKVWIRYVVVPGWSDDDDSAHRLGEFTRDMGNVEKIELLPYHELGKHKWVAMGEEYKLDGVKPPKKETMERVKGILEQYGHKVMF